jgi:hypothetical protein
MAGGGSGTLTRRRCGWGNNPPQVKGSRVQWGCLHFNIWQGGRYFVSVVACIGARLAACFENQHQSRLQLPRMGSFVEGI